MKTWKLNFKKHEILRGNSGKGCTNLFIENYKVLLKKECVYLKINFTVFLPNHYKTCLESLGL